jgi:hypothetical protein
MVVPDSRPLAPIRGKAFDFQISEISGKIQELC